MFVATQPEAGSRGFEPVGQCQLEAYANSDCSDEFLSGNDALLVAPTGSGKTELPSLLGIERVEGAGSLYQFSMYSPPCTKQGYGSASGPFLRPLASTCHYDTGTQQRRSG